MIFGLLLSLTMIFPSVIMAKEVAPETESIQIEENQMTAACYTSDGYIDDDVVDGAFYHSQRCYYSYLIDNGDSSKTLLESNEVLQNIAIETYDTDDERLSKTTIPFELPIFGAFYSGKKYNYITFGENNLEEDNNKEVIRIVRYDKAFNRIDSVSIKGGESFTIRPFDCGTPRMNENGNELVLHTSRQRYTTSDGLNHQSQLTIIVDTDTMQVINYLGEFQANHVSHSFEQFVQFDGNDHVLIDLGDGYPRAVVLNKENGSDYIEKELFPITGSIGDNYTGVSVGGFEVSNTNYIVAFNSYDQSGETYQNISLGKLSGSYQNRDIILSVLSKNSIQSEVKCITLAKYVGTNKRGSIPKLVKISDTQLMVLWQEFDTVHNQYGIDAPVIADLKYVLVDENGMPTGSIQSVPGYKLSHTSPILMNNEVVWCTHELGEKYFYSIPVSGIPETRISSFTADKESGQTEGTSIGLTASAIGGSGSYQYRFYYKNESGISVIQDFSSADTANFMPEAAGTYVLFVDVKDPSGKTATKSIENFQIIDAPKSTVKSFETDKVSGQCANTEIKLSAEGSGGITPYEYKFYYQYNNEITNIQNFSTANTANFQPAQAGIYEITVEIKDARGDIATKTIENYQILEPEREILTSYTTHVQNVGWQDWIQNGATSGTVGQGLRLEGIRIYLITKLKYDLDVSYSTHIQNIGWQKPQNFGFVSGTTGQGLRLEAIKMNLTGSDSDKFDIYYQVHAENFGWLDWAKNGEESGTAGFGYRLEGIRILVVPKGDSAPGATTIPFVQK